MKLLCAIEDRVDAFRIRTLLEEKGIPIYCKPNLGFGPGWFFSRSSRTYLFVCMDSQFKDAEAILRFPSHSPSEPVDAQKFHSDVESASYGPVLKMMIGPVLAIGLLCLLVIWAVYHFGRSSHF